MGAFRTLGTALCLLLVTDIAQAALAASTLPSSRSVQIGSQATAFATIIHVGETSATGCGIEPLTSVAADFFYQQTDPATNASIGEPNTPATIAPGAFQTFIFGFTPTAEITPTNVSLSFNCDNSGPAGITPGLNDLFLSASVDPVPDIVALAATVSGDGIVTMPLDNQFGFFSVASVNLGTEATVTVTPGTDITFNGSLLICETDPLTAACLAGPAASVTTTIVANGTPTFSIFVSSPDEIGANAALNRVFVRFADTGDQVRGSTSVAIQGGGISPPQTATQVFADDIEQPIIQSRCIACHVNGGIAGSTGLVFNPASVTDHEALNFAVFEGFLAPSPDRLTRVLEKASATISHTGGKQLPVGSADYTNMATFLTLLEATIDRQGAETPDLTGSAVEQYYHDQITGPVLENACLNCHVPEGPSGHTRLVFAPSTETGYEATNLSVLQAFLNEVAGADELILNKVQGVSHGGGTVFSSQSDEFLGLAVFLDLLTGGTGDGINPDEADVFWDGVNLASPRVTLRRAALIMAERLPTDNEYAMAEADDAGMQDALVSLMDGEGFHAFLIRGANDRLLTDAFLNGLPFDLTDLNFPYFNIGAQRKYDHYAAGLPGNEFWEDYHAPWNYGMARSPLELIAYVVEEDRPYTEIMTADYWMMNPLMAETSRADIDFPEGADRDTFLPGVHRGQILQGQGHQGEFVLDVGYRTDVQGDFVEDYPHAGILNTAAFLNRYPSTDTNRNRARARWTYYHFLGVDIEKAAPRTTDPEALADTNNPTMNNPSCAVCHQLHDPVAATFANYGDEGWYRDHWSGEHSLPDTYANTWDDTGFVEGDVWYNDMREPAINGQLAPDPKRALPWLAGQIAQDPRFATATVLFWWQAVMGSDPLDAPESATDPGFVQRLAAYSNQRYDIEALAEEFRTGSERMRAYNLRDLLAAMAMSPWFRADRMDSAPDVARTTELAAAGTGRLLTPAELDAKTRAIIGWSYGEEPWNEYPNSQLLDNYPIYYGGIDSAGITKRARALTPLMSNVVAKQAYDMACPATVMDFHVTDGQRRLFNGIERATTPTTELTADADAPGASYDERTTVRLSGVANAGERRLAIHYNNSEWNSEIQQGRQLYVAGVTLSRDGEEFMSVPAPSFRDQPAFYISEWFNDQDGSSGFDGDDHWEEVSPGQWEQVAFVIWGWHGELGFNLTLPESGTWDIDVEVWANQLPDGVEGNFTVSIDALDPYAGAVGESLIRGKIEELHRLFLGETTVDPVELDASYDYLVETWIDRMDDPEVGNTSHAWPLEQCWINEGFQGLDWLAVHRDPQYMVGTWAAFLIYLMTDYAYLHE